MSIFRIVFSFTDSVKMQGGKTLVHCQAGISRSATICLAYIMYTERLSLDAAFEYVKSRRNVISPNVNFMQQLHNFEKEILHKTVQTPKMSPCRIYSVSSPNISFFSYNDLQSPDYLSLSAPDVPTLLQSPGFTPSAVVQNQVVTFT